MKNITITEIRNYLKAQDAELRKARFLINGKPAYVVTYADGAYKTLTTNHLKEAFLEGDI